jgi:hypothetical protein
VRHQPARGAHAAHALDVHVRDPDPARVEQERRRQHALLRLDDLVRLAVHRRRRHVRRVAAARAERRHERARVLLLDDRGRAAQRGQPEADEVRLAGAVVVRREGDEVGDLAPRRGPVLERPLRVEIAL